jgi:hypothetical protein
LPWLQVPPMVSVLLLPKHLPRQAQRLLSTAGSGPLWIKLWLTYKAEGITAKGYISDVTDEKQVQKLVADIEKDLGT